MEVGGALNLQTSVHYHLKELLVANGDNSVLVGVKVAERVRQIL